MVTLDGYAFLIYSVRDLRICTFRYKTNFKIFKQINYFSVEFGKTFQLSNFQNPSYNVRGPNTNDGVFVRAATDREIQFSVYDLLNQMVKYFNYIQAC